MNTKLGTLRLYAGRSKKIKRKRICECEAIESLQPVFGLPPQAMRRQVRRDAQPARDVPTGTLPALRDADLMVGREPATLQGDAPSFREFLTEHRQSALRLGPGRFVLQHIPMLGEDTVSDTHDVRGNPIFR